MALSASAKDYLSRFFPGPPSPLWETDPEFMELFANFALDEVVNQGDLDDAARMMAILATLLGCQGVEEYRVLLPAALRAGVTPVQVKEILYQSVAYLGIGRVRPFFSVTNQVLTEQGVALPLEPGSTTTAETRLAAGNQAQVDIFGEGMRGFQNSGPEESRHINRWLADNCFGDYYTRGGLDYKQREMITFCFLAALGGCEPQLTSHAGANLRIGNDNAFLIQVISQCLPYIGYPRSLNALRCVNDAAQAARGEENGHDHRRSEQEVGYFSGHPSLLRAPRPDPACPPHQGRPAGLRGGVLRLDPADEVHAGRRGADRSPDRICGPVPAGRRHPGRPQGPAGRTAGPAGVPDGGDAGLSGPAESENRPVRAGYDDS